MLSLLVGFEVISKVPATLHTPLMSAANSIHGVVLVGAMLHRGHRAQRRSATCSASSPRSSPRMNVVGGYVVTDRMLGMFRKRPAVDASLPEQRDAAETAAGRPGARP